MSTIIVKEGDKTVIKTGQKMDTLNSTEFEDAIQPLFKEPNPDYIIDYKKLEYISSSGLRLFMSILKYTQSKDGKLILINMQPKVKDIFDMIGFTALFKIV